MSAETKSNIVVFFKSGTHFNNEDVSDSDSILTEDNRVIDLGIYVRNKAAQVHNKAVLLSDDGFTDEARRLAKEAEYLFDTAASILDQNPIA